MNELDNLCDTCKKPMHIRRNLKNSRFLVCRNSQCKSGAKNISAEEKDAQELSAKNAKNTPTRKPLFGFGF